MYWNQLFDQFENLPVLVIGDLMLDTYLYGRVSRISPEAPVPIVEWEHEESRPGGAANVALNLSSLGAAPLLCGLVGTDEEGTRLKQLLEKHQLTIAGICDSDKRHTTVKQRILASGQQLIRIDREDQHDLSADEQVRLLQRIRELLALYNPVVAILQDYNKGVLSASMIQALIQLLHASGVSICVDPKEKNFWEYRNVDFFKPNLREVSKALQRKIEPTEEALADAAAQLMQRLNCHACLVTLSEHGAYYCNKNYQGIFPTVKRNVADVSGAGDTVIAAAALGLATGMPVEHLVTFANLAGSQVVEQVGVVPVNKIQLLDELNKHHLVSWQNP